MLRRVCVRGEALPALCGASLKGKGLEPLLDAMIAFLPSPLDRPKPGTPFEIQTPLSMYIIPPYSSTSTITFAHAPFSKPAGV